MVLASMWFEGGELAWKLRTAVSFAQPMLPKWAARSCSTDHTEADRPDSLGNSQLSRTRVK